MSKQVHDMQISSDLPAGWRIEQGFCEGTEFMGCLIKKVPISAHGDSSKVGGEYTIRVARRPFYCDRGDWQLFVDAEGDTRLDFADGFPRYFFGNAQEAMEQMEKWINKRKEIIHANTEAKEAS